LTDLFFKAAGGIVLAVIMCLVLAKQGKEMSVLLTVAVCSIVGISGIRLTEPVIQFMQTLQHSGNLNTELFSILLKVVGIGLITQIASTICADAGNASLGKILQYLACIVILCLCLPLMESLMALVETVLGNV
jgi:stage III sporulation protein AD